MQAPRLESASTSKEGGMTIFHQVREAVRDLKAGVSADVVRMVWGEQIARIAVDCAGFS